MRDKTKLSRVVSNALPFEKEIISIMSKSEISTLATDFS